MKLPIAAYLHLSTLVSGLRNELATRSRSDAQPLQVESPRQSWTVARRSLKDWKLADIAVVATLDGSLHALERTTGDIRWTISSSDAAVQTHDGNVQNTSDPVLRKDKETWIVEPIDDGCLYTFNTKEGLKKLPFGIKQLVENSPFTVPGDDKVYVGERKTTLYSVDPKTGNVLRAYGTDFAHTSSAAPKCPARDSLDDLDEECAVSDPDARDVLKIGRNTYTLTIFTGTETLWNVTYTEWVPNSVDIDLQRQYEGTLDGQYISPLHDGRVLAHQTETNDATWFKQLGAPAVRVYDVLHQYDDRHTYTPEVNAVALVPQPLDPHFNEINHENYVDGGISTYIGRTPGGDWYALSAQKCPLVSSAPMSKWTEGFNTGSEDDLFGIHTHERTEIQEPRSPGHRPTIDGPAIPKTIDHIRESNLWMYYSIAATILAIIVGWRMRSIVLPSTIPKLEAPIQAVIEPMQVEQPPLAIDEPILDKITEIIEPIKPKRKRGSRGGRKVREKAEEEESKEDVIEPEIINVIKEVAVKPIAADSSFPLQLNSLLVTDKILGYGSHGTIVYQGSFEGRDVAVKRMLLDFYDIASHEVVLLQESDDHPNVIRYYCKQENERFLYIALELCAASLADVVERPHDFETLTDSMNDIVSIMKQMALGVQYLHSLKIVHRDLKPQNILVNPPRASKNGSVQCARLVISDFGLCKKLDADQSSFRATTAQAAGTSGWRAPELLTDADAKPSESSTSGGLQGAPRTVSRAIDIFSLGCVFYYILSNGAHPFGDRYMREGNIIKGRFNLDHLDILGDLGVMAKDLIASMIQTSSKARPDASLVLQHPFFWSAERRLNFLLDISDRFEVEERDPPSPLLMMLESKSAEILQNNWHIKLDRNLIDNLGKYRKYNPSSILDLLRALRNKKHHYQDLPPNVQVALGSIPVGFLGYFTSRFPLLLLHTYHLAQSELSEEAIFDSYFS